MAGAALNVGPATQGVNEVVARAGDDIDALLGGEELRRDGQSVVATAAAELALAELGENEVVVGGAGGAGLPGGCAGEGGAVQAEGVLRDGEVRAEVGQGRGGEVIERGLAEGRVFAEDADDPGARLGEAVGLAVGEVGGGEAGREQDARFERLKEGQLSVWRRGLLAGVAA